MCCVEALHQAFVPFASCLDQVGAVKHAFSALVVMGWGVGVRSKLLTRGIASEVTTAKAQALAPEFKARFR